MHQPRTWGMMHHRLRQAARPFPVHILELATRQGFDGAGHVEHQIGAPSAARQSLPIPEMALHQTLTGESKGPGTPWIAHQQPEIRGLGPIRQEPRHKRRPDEPGSTRQEDSEPSHEPRSGKHLSHGRRISNIRQRRLLFPSRGPSLKSWICSGKCHNFTRAKDIQAKGFYPYFMPIASSEGTEVEIDGRNLIMIGSNNYLGLTHHPHVLEAARNAVDQLGSSCTGSRFLNGTLELHEELEQRLARFLQRESALCFSTGFQANLGVISALCGKGDVIFFDRENHASIFDGCRLTFADTKKFSHNDPDQLEAQLKRARDKGAQGMLIIVDGVFSMMGDLANLPMIASLARKYEARLMVDEAHSVGVLGDHGRGTAEHFGVEDDVDLIVGTFSKSFASIGGFVAGPEPVIHHIKHNARSLIFSASIPPSAAAAALAALDVFETEPELRQRLVASASRVKRGLEDIGYNIGPTQTPIVPVVIGDEAALFRFWKALFRGGLFTNPVTHPAVPRGADLIRTSFMATHTDEQLTRVLEIFENVGKSMGLVSGSAQTPPTPQYRRALG